MRQKFQILRKESPKRTAFFKFPVTFDDDLLITGDTYSPKIDPILSSFEIMTSRS